MGGIFSKPKSPKAPPPPEPPPEVIEEDIETDVKKRARKSGKRTTLLTPGDLAKPAEQFIGRKQLLG